jgi:hypothetical protein
LRRKEQTFGDIASQLEAARQEHTKSQIALKGLQEIFQKVFITAVLHCLTCAFQTSGDANLLQRECEQSRQRIQDLEKQVPPSLFPPLPPPLFISPSYSLSPRLSLLLARKLNA